MSKGICKLIILLMVFNPYSLYAAGDYESGKSKSQVCAACHGIDGNSKITMYPILAGQYKNYLVNALHAYKSGKRNNAIMSGFATGLTNQDIDDLATYFSNQKGLKILPAK